MQKKTAKYNQVHSPTVEKTPRAYGDRLSYYNFIDCDITRSFLEDTGQKHGHIYKEMARDTEIFLEIKFIKKRRHFLKRNNRR